MKTLSRLLVLGLAVAAISGAHGASPAVAGAKSVAKAAGDCRLQSAETFAVARGQGPTVDMLFPYGINSFEFTDCPGEVEVVYEYPQVVEGLQLWKRIGGRWIQLTQENANLVIKGATVTYTIADNGPFDADPQVGVISDPAGLGYVALPEAPDAPTDVLALTAGDGSIAIGWTAPKLGNPAVRYIVSEASGLGSCLADAPSTSCTVSGLALGGSYVFSVVAENAGGTSASVSVAYTNQAFLAFAGNVRAVVSGFYQTILGRAPDQAGLDYWAAEAERVTALGADVREVFFAMSMAFFSSAEYPGSTTSDTQYITDLYRTFFNRAPDAAGLAYWQGELTASGSRSALLNNFLFSAEFSSQMTEKFGAVSVRPEVTLAIDLFRGAFGRLPDSAGFNYWLGRLRSAQCQGALAVTAEVGSMSNLFFTGAEYSLRNRNDRDYVGDLYNAYMRRGPGADTAGFNYWVGRIPTLGRDGVRAQFVPSAEFQGRVAAVVSAGCLP